MTGGDLKAYAKELTLFHDRFSEFFIRKEVQKKSKDYMTALMLDGERKACTTRNWRRVRQAPRRNRIARISHYKRSLRDLLSRFI